MRQLLMSGFSINGFDTPELSNSLAFKDTTSKTSSGFRRYSGTKETAISTSRQAKSNLLNLTPTSLRQKKPSKTPHKYNTIKHGITNTQNSTLHAPSPGNRLASHNHALLPSEPHPASARPYQASLTKNVLPLERSRARLTEREQGKAKKERPGPRIMGEADIGAGAREPRQLTQPCLARHLGQNKTQNKTQN
ncbi:hypothetical protein J6590_076868 [Homalodisca vitripennis]|nr:hypothetical protein J6590_076868 [Homalodisca vitripennis]